MELKRELTTIQKLIKNRFEKFGKRNVFWRGSTIPAWPGGGPATPIRAAGGDQSVGVPPPARIRPATIFNFFVETGDCRLGDLKENKRKNDFAPPARPIPWPASTPSQSHRAKKLLVWTLYFETSRKIYLHGGWGGSPGRAPEWDSQNWQITNR